MPDPLRFLPRKIIGVAAFRQMSAVDIKALDAPLAIKSNPAGENIPLAVLVPFGIFVQMQKLIYDKENAHGSERKGSGTTETNEADQFCLDKRRGSSET